MVDPLNDDVARDPASGVRLLGEPVSYLDGSEEYVAEVLGAVSDRSEGSDELAAAVRDWPSRYHFSRQRANLLRPLRLEEGTRVLDVGAGTGALARYLGEAGCEVVALEGSLERARLAATRCGDLPDVEVACGRPADVEGSFDLVLVVGVLEYAGASVGGGEGPTALLQHLRSLVATGGALALAIENQFGLKYLLGYPEDHRGEPWVGVQGYPGPPGPRTWSRAELGHMLGTAGFYAQRWLFPFPDYKLPSVVLDEQVYELDDAETVVDQVVHAPIVDFAHQTTSAVDERAAHRQFVGAGLGPEVANSFLVLAGSDTASVDRFRHPDGLALLAGRERRRAWRRVRILVSRGGTRRLEPMEGEGGTEAWLHQLPAEQEEWVEGATVERLALDACAAHDRDAIAQALRRWRSFLEATTIEGTGDHPFRPRRGARALPSDHLDVDLGNFVVARDAIRYIDREWATSGPVDLELVSVRALWYFAQSLVTTRAAHPFGPEATINEIAQHLGKLAGVSVDADILARWWDAESEFQHLVTGQDVSEARKGFDLASRLSGQGMRDTGGTGSRFRRLFRSD